MVESGTVGVALPTIPAREVQAARVVRTLLDQGVVSVFVYLNGSIPAWVEDPCVTLGCYPTGTGPLVRFRFFPTTELVLTVDDDIHYPSTYVEHMTQQLRRLGPGHAVTLHGAVWPQGKSRYVERKLG